MSQKRVFYFSSDSELLEFDGTQFAESTFKRAKKGFCAAVVPSYEIRTHTFKIEAESDKERLDTLVEITMFEAGGLNIEKEYSITYVKHRLDFESSWLIEAFAVEHSKLQELFGEAAKKCGRLDLLAVPYMVYESLYTYEKVEREGVDLYLYISEESSFAVLFKDGRYIAHRDLPSLDSIAAKANVTSEVVKEALKNRGLESEAYGSDELLLIETLQDSFSKIVERVAQTVNHKRGVFAIKGVDRLYLDFERSAIPGLWELFDSYGFDGSSKGALLCCEELEPAREHNGVEALYILAAAEEKVEACNLTIFEKKRGFLKSHTGKFLAVSAAALLLSMGYTLLKESELEAIESENGALLANLNSLKERAARMRKVLAQEKRGLEAAAAKLKESKEKIMALEESLDAALLIEESKIYRREMTEDINRAMAKERLLASSFEQNGSKRVEVEILSSYAGRDRIAKFMKELLGMGYRSVGTETIKLDEDLYSSKVEIVR
ncbi:MAG: hypothetical protein L3J42_06100 [Hydrogenimonas sp.]|nr:hypothetical protein [Hydrogenimonas sp.]